MIVFTVQRLKELRERKGQVSGTLVPRSSNVKPPRHGKRKVYSYYREYRHVDEDGNRLPGKSMERVMAGDVAAQLTVVSVERINVRGQLGCFEQWPSGGRHLELPDARLCGHKDLVALREDWAQRHPYSELAMLVWFVLGDFRDSDRYLQRRIHAGGDYTRAYDPNNVVDELPALTPEQLTELAAHNHQRHTARQAQAASSLAGKSLAQRVAEIEAAGERMTEHELEIIRERVRRGLRKLA